MVGAAYGVFCNLGGAVSRIKGLFHHSVDTKGVWAPSGLMVHGKVKVMVSVCTSAYDSLKIPVPGSGSVSVRGRQI